MKEFANAIGIEAKHAPNAAIMSLILAKADTVLMDANCIRVRFKMKFDYQVLLNSKEILFIGTISHRIEIRIEGWSRDSENSKVYGYLSSEAGISLEFSTFIEVSFEDTINDIRRNLQWDYYNAICELEESI